MNSNTNITNNTDNTYETYKYDITKNDNFIEIKKIYHISDIHINLRFRHKEYEEVFKRLYYFLINEKKK